MFVKAIKNGHPEFAPGLMSGYIILNPLSLCNEIFVMPEDKCSNDQLILLVMKNLVTQKAL